MSNADEPTRPEDDEAERDLALSEEDAADVRGGDLSYDIKTNKSV